MRHRLGHTQWTGNSWFCNIGFIVLWKFTSLAPELLLAVPLQHQNVTVWCLAPLAEPEPEILSPKQYNEHPWPFRVGSPLPGLRLSLCWSGGLDLSPDEWANVTKVFLWHIWLPVKLPVALITFGNFWTPMWAFWWKTHGIVSAYNQAQPSGSAIFLSLGASFVVIGLHAALLSSSEASEELTMEEVVVSWMCCETTVVPKASIGFSVCSTKSNFRHEMGSFDVTGSHLWNQKGRISLFFRSRGDLL